MEQKNENKFLKLKNYSCFLLDLGLNVPLSPENDIGVEQSKIKEKFKSIEDIDNYIIEWQIKDDLQLSSYIKKLKIPIKKVAVELNEEIIDKNKLSKIKLKNNDKIEIVHFIGGG